MNLSGKTAIITGSSRGIGAATALKLAKLGANIVLNYNSPRGEAAVADLEAKIKELGRKVIKIKANVGHYTAAQELITASLEAFTKIDILVNNAGITRDKLLLRMSEEDWDRVIEVNLKGVFNCTKAVARHMIKEKSGKIINVSSVVGLMGNAGQANYAAAKAGIIGFTKTMARELAPRGITVNAVAPGYIETDMTKDLTEKVKEQLLSAIPLNRLGKVEDVANLIAFLASREADYINGQVINVDGGMAM